MDALRAQEKAGEAQSRAARRPQVAQAALSEWWRAQGARHGFRAVEEIVRDYRAVALEPRRARGRSAPQLGLSRLTGEVEVIDPALFSARVAAGFGRAKAFGCGLLLLKRAT
jgi:CRISPR system Cascade subunit CasE